MKKFLKTLSWGGGNGLKPSSSACFEQYSNVKLGARKGAFTLAEVLITLGIIGVVAALTLPSLIQKYQDQVLENQLKKMYSTLSQGIQKAMADDGVSVFGDTELSQACRYPEQKSNTCAQMVKKYFNVVAVKTTRSEYYDGVIRRKLGEYGGYFRDKSRRRSSPFGYIGNPIYVLADGSEFQFTSNRFNYSAGYDGYFFIDTNGEKGPNVMGLDVFTMKVEDSANGSNLTGNIYEGEYFTAIQKNNWKFPW